MSVRKLDLGNDIGTRDSSAKRPLRYVSARKADLMNGIGTRDCSAKRSPKYVCWLTLQRWSCIRVVRMVCIAALYTADMSVYWRGTRKMTRTFAKNNKMPHHASYFGPGRLAYAGNAQTHDTR
ncbi:hypothetical protein PAXINDRAFT_173211 [Paxillus involutus ATCC 200175]|uniref:Uncharacterized protein n=1 Tax=Paxillus involutus ATCC 200175 TaxID=664439 RepID=A0A0C9TKH5_PAXIN|nr:hypothetical protein PAXINDRAFT_173211 [Paxillus involutus ATCC 200175]